MTRIAIFGAAPDTPNMGVSALFHSTITNIKKRIPGAEFVVFDYGTGKRKEAVKMDRRVQLDVTKFGLGIGRRYFKTGNLAVMNTIAAYVPSLAGMNKGLELLDSCDVVLDASAGDSFSDIYGNKRFLSIVRPKLLTAARGIPLILLPQTYGPFKSDSANVLACKALGICNMAWARDERSYQTLKDLLAEKFDGNDHLCGVDIAFGLQPEDCFDKLEDKLQNWIKSPGSIGATIGLNVSGLIYSDLPNSVKSYGFKANYKVVLVEFLKKLLKLADTRIVLIPHVMSEPGHYESDSYASELIRKEIGPDYEDRIAISPGSLDQNEAKWLISQLDWFCGTRMHSTIASLSSGVPTAAVAYSDKTRGVFETCLQGNEVIDPRVLDTEQSIQALYEAFNRRGEVADSLVSALPAVRSKVEEQFRMISERIESS